MLYLRDKTIMKLAEDRDLIKIKLTKAMNMNIELSRQLMKYQRTQSQPTVQQNTTTTATTPQHRTKSPVNAQIREEVADLRRKCTELDEIYHHLKHHLFALRNVFADLGTMNNPFPTANDSGSGYHMDNNEDRDDSTSVLSSVSATISPIKPKQHFDPKTSGNYIIDELTPDDDLVDDGDTDFRPLPPTRPSLLRSKATPPRANGVRQVDSNNNGNGGVMNGFKSNHQEIKNGNNHLDSPRPAVVTEPLSNFDIWYNS